MQRANAFVIALLLGAAVVIGSVAALKTVELKGASAKPAAVSSQALAKRSARLDRAEISLRKALSHRPPKLPDVPHFSAVAGSQSAAAAPAPPRIVRYVRPAPIVVTTHRSAGEENDSGEHEHEGGGGGDD